MNTIGVLVAGALVSFLAYSATRQVVFSQPSPLDNLPPDLPPIDSVTVTPDSSAVPQPTFSGVLTDDQIASVAADAGFDGIVLGIAVAIALAESGGDPNAVGDVQLAQRTNGAQGPSIGLWQINIGTKANYQWRNEALTDPAVNAAKAFILYSQRHGFGAWSTYDPRDGSTPKYLAFLDRGNQAAGV